jgi:hypothetical protein
MQLTRANLFLIVAFVLVLFAVISFAGNPMLGVPATVWAWGGVDSFLLAQLV